MGFKVLSNLAAKEVTRGLNWVGGRPVERDFVDETANSLDPGKTQTLSLCDKATMRWNSAGNS